MARADARTQHGQHIARVGFKRASHRSDGLAGDVLLRAFLAGVKQADGGKPSIHEKHGATIRDVHSEWQAGDLGQQSIRVGDRQPRTGADDNDLAAVNLVRGDKRRPGRAEGIEDVFMVPDDLAVTQGRVRGDMRQPQSEGVAEKRQFGQRVEDQERRLRVFSATRRDWRCGC